MNKEVSVREEVLKDLRDWRERHAKSPRYLFISVLAYEKLKKEFDTELIVHASGHRAKFHGVEVVPTLSLKNINWMFGE